MTPHPALRLVGPVIFAGGLLAVLGALIFSGRIAIENGELIGSIILACGGAALLFGMITRAAWRAVESAHRQNEQAQAGDKE
ncbi:hypothetical protein [Hyphobacterium sp.]|uniref:hypothetical protein n=1 Tax=Hyphobacterium sp. TaxID=2004662 RepID=UPI003BA9400B